MYKRQARDSIRQLREGADAQIAASNDLIQRLRERIRVDGGADVDAVIDEQQNKIREANITIDNLTENKYSLEAENRKLEAEVGPVKYIAEMVYGEAADRNMLEEAVRWVILLIVAVFDPLAIVLVLAGVMTIHKFDRKRLEEQDRNEPENDSKPVGVKPLTEDRIEPKFEDVDQELIDNEFVEAEEPELVVDAEVDTKKVRTPAKPDAGDEPEEPKKKKDHPDNSWLNT